MGDKCVQCEKAVYPAEKLKAINKIYHKTCFKCGDCSKRLNLDNYLEHDEEPFCTKCHQNNFGARGFRGGGGASGMMVAGNYDGKRPVVMPSQRWNNSQKFGDDTIESNPPPMKDYAKTDNVRNYSESNAPGPMRPKPAPTRVINEEEEEEDYDEDTDIKEQGLLEMIQEHEYYQKASDLLKTTYQKALDLLK